MAKKIVIADDEEEILSFLHLILEQEGYAVASTTHGGKLPELVSRERPDLLILDLMMPGLDGYSLQLKLAQDAATKDVPIIIMTALDAARSLFERTSQVRYFLKKPFGPEDLLPKLKTILGE